MPCRLTGTPTPLSRRGSTMVNVVYVGPRSGTALESTGGGSRSKRRCPRCRRKLSIATVGSEPAVEIDRCPLEHGLWFDAGELKTLITSFAGGEAGAVAEFLGDLLRYELDVGPKGE